MTKAPLFPLPNPWRQMQEKNSKLSTNSPYYDELRDAFKTRSTRLIPNELVDTWDADQTAQTISIKLTEGQEICASFQFIGTYDGTTFMWGDANTSLNTALTQKAKETRKWLQDNNWPSLIDDKFHASLRDVLALLALSGQILDAEKLFLASTGNSYVALVLENIRAIPSEQRPQKKIGVLGRLLKGKKDQSFSSPMDIINQQISNQIARVQPKESALANIEKKYAEIKQQYNIGAFQKALDELDLIHPLLGEHPIDSEPSGWFFLCQGACHLALGNKKKAKESFDKSLRTILIPSYSTTLLGLSRCHIAPDEELSTLKACYIYNTKWFEAHASSNEITDISNEITSLLDNHPGPAATAKASLEAAITALYNCELEASRLSKIAREQRVDRHQTCEADQLAKIKYNAAYRDILLTFFTQDKQPYLSSISSHPEPNPDTSLITEVTQLSPNQVSITVIKPKENITKDSADTYEPTGNESTHRYLMIKETIALSNISLWRIDKIWSVWPDEEILLIQ
ncbi:MAG: DUF6882 domain-containing protein [Maricaulaceae bacterium]